jgi:hypothetical protein
MAGHSVVAYICLVVFVRVNNYAWAAPSAACTISAVPTLSGVPEQHDGEPYELLRRKTRSQ